jgi:signal transduction histidine kinase
MSEMTDSGDAIGSELPAAFGAGDLVLLRATEYLRWAGLVPMLAAIWIRRDSLDRPIVAFGTVGLAVAYSCVTSLALGRRDPMLLRPRTVAVGVGVAAVLMASDGWVFNSLETFSPPALGAVWVLAEMLHVGIALGPAVGLLAGVGVVACRMVGVWAPDVHRNLPLFFRSDFNARPRLIPIVSLMCLYGIVGVGAGFLARLQRRAEAQISAAKAREEVARTLHDGVLQTLALVQRRATDPALVDVARQTDLELRNFLTGATYATGSLDQALRATCSAFAQRFGITPQLLVDDLPRLAPRSIRALSGATSEALANAGKHANARHVTVFACRPESDGGVLVTVNDDGQGFDTQSIPPDRGISKSLAARLQEVGGRLSISSTIGAGTEVVLWVP